MKPWHRQRGSPGTAKPELGNRGRTAGKRLKMRCGETERREDWQRTEGEEEEKIQKNGMPLPASSLQSSAGIKYDNSDNK